MYNYVVTAQKPTAVSHSLVGNFTGSKDVNLVVAKCSRVEIHLLTPEGLQPMIELPIYGRIATLELFRPPKETQDLLLLSTERYKFCVLRYDAATGEVETRANGDVKDLIGRPTDSGQIGIVDPECRMFGLHIYDGLFKVIAIGPDGSLAREAFNIRLDELQVLDIQFLHGYANPTICVLYEDATEARHVKTYEVLLAEKDFAEGPWAQSNVDNGATIVIPVPLPIGGAIILGEQTVLYHSGQDNRFKAIPVGPMIVRAFGRIDPDGSRYLMGDHNGNLSLLALQTAPADSGGVGDKPGSSSQMAHLKVTGITVEHLGVTSLAQTISYLDNGVVFIGSVFGDSQLVRLHADKDPSTGSYVEILDHFTNLGPIVDMCVVDVEKQGQGHLVTCSGAFKDGSLRVVRNGIGINEQASVDLPGIKGIFPLRSSGDPSAPDAYLVVTFISETRVLAITDEDELEETELAGFVSNSHSLLCCNALGGHIVQVTPEAVMLANAATGSAVATWNPPGGSGITVANSTSTHIALALSGGRVVLLEVLSSGALNEAGASLEVGEDVSCLDLSTVDVNSEHAMTDDVALDASRASKDGPPTVLVVGTWSMKVSLFMLPGLVPLAKADLGGEVIPRDTLLTNFDGIVYLLVAMGDGQLLNYRVEDGGATLSDRKRVCLGTKPLSLRTFEAKGTTNVFAAGDRPTVVYSSNGKLVYSNINLREVSHVCPFNSKSFPDSLAVSTDDMLMIGTVDDIQKLHIRTVPLGEQPRRLAHQESSGTFAVGTLKMTEVTEMDVDDVGAWVEERSFVRVLDDQTFEPVTSVELERFEQTTSVLSCRFTEDDSGEYYCVGTAYAIPEEPEPTRGRILVFRMDSEGGKLVLICERETKGAVYQLNAFNGKLLAAINNKVQLYRWLQRDDGGRELVNECGHHGHVMALYMRTRGDFIVVGDLLKSVSLLLYKPEEGIIEERARDYESAQMTATEILDEDTYLGATGFNLFTVRRPSDAPTEEGLGRLEKVGQFHLGEFVNPIRYGSLVMRLQPDGPVGLGEVGSSGDRSLGAPDAEPKLLMATVNGAIFVLAGLGKEEYLFLAKLQSKLTKVIHGVGGFQHKDWRSFHNGLATLEAKGFIDGDLVEAFLDLKKDKAAEVAKALGVSLSDLTKHVEDLARMH